MEVCNSLPAQYKPQAAEQLPEEKNRNKSLTFSTMSPLLASLLVLLLAHYLYRVRLIKEGKLSQIFL